MHIGYSEIDITPCIGVELCGYGMYPVRRSEAVKDNLYARAVAFIEGEKKLLLLNCDLLTLSRQIVEEVKQQLMKDLGLRAEDILLLSTHTHTGPNASDTEGIGERDEGYVQALPALLVRAGSDAFKNTRQVKEARQIKTELGKSIGYNRVNPNGPVDHTLRGMSFHFEKEKPIAILSYGCHPVTLGPSREISADYPGSVVRAMNRAGYDCLFLTGFCGDIDPVSNKVQWGSGTQETIDEYGNRIADAFIKKATEAGCMEDLSLDSFEVPVKLRMVELTSEDLDRMLEENIGEKETYPGKYKLLQVWAVRMKQELVKKENPYEKTIVTQVFKIGKVVMFGFAAEMFTALGFPLGEAFPEENVMALGNANVTTGYIATRDDIENKGYAGFGSSFLYLTFPLQAGEGEKLAREVAKEAKARLARPMKKVLLLGDSIRLGYQTLVAEKLSGRAEVVGPEENGRFTKYTLWYVNIWMEALGKPDIIHWNNGLWDVYRHNSQVGIFTPLEEYLCELKRILTELRKTGAKIIWGSTTPVSPDHPFCNNSEIDLYNKAAEELMRSENIEINDLNGRLKEKVPLYICEDYIHLTDQGKDACAEAIAAAINKYL